MVGPIIFGLLSELPRDAPILPAVITQVSDMTDHEQMMESTLSQIRAYAAVINKDNWRDIQMRLRIEFDALAAEATHGELDTEKKNA